MARLAARIGPGSTVGLLWAALACVQTPPAIAPRDVAAVDAPRLYAGACASCHGQRGDGRASGVGDLGAPRPRNFTSGVYKFRSTPSGALPTDADLYRTISRGVPRTWMPAWEGLLSEPERWALAGYVKSFYRGFATDEPEPAVPIPPAPPVSSELLREGRFVYVVLRCGQCHGARGVGDGPSAPELTDDWGARIRLYDLTRLPYKNGSTPEDIYRTLVTGLSGTPMPALEPPVVAFPGGADAFESLRRELSPAEFADVQTYLAGQPAAAELARLPQEDIDALAQRRLWALGYYVRSLIRPRTPFSWLFRENPDLAPRERQP